jgi:hypothetical protein
MSELSVVVICIVTSVASVLATILSYARIIRRSKGQSPTTWRLNHSKDFKDLKAKYFHKEDHGVESESHP